MTSYFHIWDTTNDRGPLAGLHFDTEAEADDWLRRYLNVCVTPPTVTYKVSLAFYKDATEYNKFVTDLKQFCLARGYELGGTCECEGIAGEIRVAKTGKMGDWPSFNFEPDDSLQLDPKEV